MLRDEPLVAVLHIHEAVAGRVSTSPKVTVVGAKLVLEPIGIVTPAGEQIYRDSFERVEIVEVEVSHGCYLLNPVSAPTG